MSYPVSGVALIAEAAYRSRYSKADAALLEELTARCGGELRKEGFVGRHAGVEFRLSFLAKQQGFVVSVPCRLVGRFRVTRKSALDRRMAEFVSARALPSRDARFDHGFTIDTRDREATAAVLTSGPNRLQVRKLFKLGARELRLDGERIQVTCARKALGREPKGEDLLALVEPLSQLAAAVDHFAAHHEARPAPKNDPRIVLAWSLLGLLGVSGFAMLIAGGVEYTLVRPASFLLPCAIFGLPAVLPVLFILSLVVRHRSAPFGLLRGLAALALVVAPLFVSAGMLLANGLFDGSPAQEHHAVVTGKSTRVDKNEVRYHAGLESWWTAGEVRWLRVSEATYERIEPRGSRMRVRTHPGTLGYEWIEGYELVP